MIFVIYEADNVLLDETTCYNSANNQKQRWGVLSAAAIEGCIRRTTPLIALVILHTPSTSVWDGSLLIRQ
jgi:hypothetical protein